MPKPKQWYSVHKILIEVSEQENENNYNSPQSTLRPGLEFPSTKIDEKEDA